METPQSWKNVLNRIDKRLFMVWSPPHHRWHVYRIENIGDQYDGPKSERIQYQPNAYDCALVKSEFGTYPRFICHFEIDVVKSCGIPRIALDVIRSSLKRIDNRKNDFITYFREEERNRTQGIKKFEESNKDMAKDVYRDCKLEIDNMTHWHMNEKTLANGEKKRIFDMADPHARG